MPADDTIDGGAGDDEIDGFAGQRLAARRRRQRRHHAQHRHRRDQRRRRHRHRRLRPARRRRRYTLDGLANDGEAGENDLIGADVENITARASSGVATLIGDGRANRLTVTDGRGDITGGDGADILEGGPLDDTIHARDGAPDTIICNGGIDTVEADTLDTVSPTCENVSTIAGRPAARSTIARRCSHWAAPTANASLSANSPSKLAVNAQRRPRPRPRAVLRRRPAAVRGHRAAVRLQPTSPRGGDVGRNTLIAVAVDGANQTTSARPRGHRAPLQPARAHAHAAPEPRPHARRTRSARPASSRARRPSRPPRAARGTVTITAKKGSKTVATHRTPLTRTCEFVTTVTLPLQACAASCA